MVKVVISEGNPGIKVAREMKPGNLYMSVQNGDVYLGCHNPVGYTPGHKVYGVRLHDGSWVSNSDCEIYPINATTITIGK